MIKKHLGIDMEGVIERLVEISEGKDEERWEEEGRRREEERGKREEGRVKDEERILEDMGRRGEEEDERTMEERRWKQDGITESIVMEVSEAIKKKEGKSEFSFQQPLTSEYEFEKKRNSVAKEDDCLNLNQNKNVKLIVEEPQKDKIKKIQLMNELTRKSVMRNQTFFFDSTKIEDEMQRKRFQTCPNNNRLQTSLAMERETKLELEGLYLRALKEVETQSNS